MSKKNSRSGGAALQQGVCGAICCAAKEMQKSFVGLFKVLNLSINLVVKINKRDELARPRAFSTHCAIRILRQYWKKTTSNN